MRQPRVGQSLTLHGVGPRIQVILRTPTLDGWNACSKISKRKTAYRFFRHSLLLVAHSWYSFTQHLPFVLFLVVDWRLEVLLGTLHRNFSATARRRHQITWPAQWDNFRTKCLGFLFWSSWNAGVMLWDTILIYPLTTVSIILNLEHLNRMNLKYKKMEQLVFCIVETIVCAESDGSPRCGHVFHVGTLRRFCVDFECAWGLFEWKASHGLGNCSAQPPETNALHGFWCNAMWQFLCADGVHWVHFVSICEWLLEATNMEQWS